MHLLIVGATGRTGRHLVDEAVAAGHTVRAFARSAADHPWPEGVVAIGGDVLDPDAVDAAMDGVDAVLVALSMVRRSDSPWAPILTPRDLHERAATALLAAAERHGVRRYLTISAQGVGPSWRRAGWLFLGLVHGSNIGVAYRNLARAEALVQQAPLDWTILRPTRLTDGPPDAPVVAGPSRRTTSLDRVPRAALARFMVQALARGDVSRQALTLTQGEP